MLWKLLKDIMWVVLFWVMFLFAFPGWGQTLSLKSEVSISGNVVRLSDVVSRLEGVNDVVLFPAPEPGDVFRISGDDLRRLLLQRGINVELKGVVKIYRRMIRLSAEEINSMLKEKLAEAGYVLAQEMKTPLLLPKNYVWEIEYPDLCPGHCYAYLNIRAEEYCRRIPIRIRPKVRLYAWVSLRDILPGEILSENDVRLVEVENIPSGAFPYNRSPIGLMTRHPLKKGEILSRSDVKLVYLVKRGDKVRIIYDQGGIRIELVGLAQQNGRVGDFIPVKNVLGGKEILARVKDRGIVEVVR